MNEQKICKGKEVRKEVYGFRYAHPRYNRSLFLLWKLFNSPALPSSLFIPDDGL
jgi:hypothetical protein